MILSADYTGMFSDVRLARRGRSLLQGLFRKNCRTILSIANTRAEQKAYYRFLNHNKVTEAGLINEPGLRCAKLSAGKQVLCIQDTTEINLSSHSGRLKPESGIGPIDAVKKGLGFINPVIV